MKICFLSYGHMYDDTRVFHKEAYSLFQEGYEVTHLALGSGQSFTRCGINIVTFVKQKGGLLSKVTNFFSFLRKSFQIDADCFHCSEIESWIAGCLLKIIRHKKLVVFDVHEHFPSRAAEPQFPRWFRWIGGPVVHILYFILTPFTDYLIFAKQSVAPDFGSSEHKSEFIFNYAPLRMQPLLNTDVSPVVKREFGASRTAIHIGSISRERGWPQLLQALTIMKNRQLNVLLLGTVVEGETTLMDEATRLGVSERIHLMTTVPYEQVFEYLKLSDIGLMLYQPGIQNHIFAFPIKMYDYMLAGIPFVAPDFAVEVAPVVRKENCGLLVDTSSAEQIAQALDWFCENRIVSQQMGHRGRAAVINRYNWEMEKDKLLAVYEKLNSIFG